MLPRGAIVCCTRVHNELKLVPLGPLRIRAEEGHEKESIRIASLLVINLKGEEFEMSSAASRPNRPRADEIPLLLLPVRRGDLRSPPFFSVSETPVPA